MPVIFRPPNIAWQIVANPEWQSDSWGLARCRVTSRGPRTTKANAEAGITPFQSLASLGFPQMYLESWQSVNTTPNFPAIEGMYVGFRGPVPQPKIGADISSQVARASGVDPVNGNKVSADVLYRASRTTYEWFMISQPPPIPIYGPLLFNNDPRQQIDRMAIQTADGSTTVPLSDMGTIFNALIPEVIISDYTIEPIIPGKIWRCSVALDYKLQST